MREQHIATSTDSLSNPIDGGIGDAIGCLEQDATVRHIGGSDERGFSFTELLRERAIFAMIAVFDEKNALLVQLSNGEPWLVGIHIRSRMLRRHVFADVDLDAGARGLVHGLDQARCG